MEKLTADEVCAGLMDLVGVKPKKVQIFGRGSYKLTFEDQMHARKVLSLHKRKVECHPVPLQATKIEQHFGPMEIFELLHEKVSTREKVDNYQQNEKVPKEVRALNSARGKTPPKGDAKPKGGGKGENTQNVSAHEKEDQVPKFEEVANAGRGWGHERGHSAPPPRENWRAPQNSAPRVWNNNGKGGGGWNNGNTKGNSWRSNGKGQNWTPNWNQNGKGSWNQNGKGSWDRNGKGYGGRGVVTTRTTIGVKMQIPPCPMFPNLRHPPSPDGRGRPPHWCCRGAGAKVMGGLRPRGKKVTSPQLFKITHLQ